MQRKSRLLLLALLAMLFLAAVLQVLKIGQASGDRDVDFEIIEFGNLSGYDTELYIVVQTEAEWAEIWERHTILYEPPKTYPEIDFSQSTVICAFMGRRPTTGYSISIDRIWADDENIHIEIIKNSPPKDHVVAQMITHPYFFASLEKTDLDFVFDITEEDGTVVRYALPEFSTIILALTAFVTLSVIISMLAHRFQKHQVNT